MLGRTSENYKPSAKKAHSYKNSSALHFVPTNWYIKDKSSNKNSMSAYKSRIDARISVKSYALKFC